MYLTGFELSFLTALSWFLPIRTVDSPVKPVLLGVPQGSVLGPLHFLIFMNDLSNNISSKVCLFADDCAIYQKIGNQDDATLLQKDLNSVLAWCQKYNMELNISKCKSVCVSHTSLACPHYYLTDMSLESASSHKYLGVHIWSNLSWKHHVRYIITKANSSLRYFRINFYMALPSLKKILYITCIHLSIEYASSTGIQVVLH